MSLTQCQTIGLTLPPLEEQRALIQQNQIRLRTLSSRAFLETWGKPTYEHHDNMQFYPVENGNFVPRFLTPMGEPPRGWDSTIVSEEAHFLAYADRGELLGFIDDRLIYHERFPTEDVHAVGRMWKHEAQFKTRLERPSPPSSKP